LAFLDDLATQPAVCDLDSASGRSVALVVVVEGTPKFGFEGLDLQGEGPDFFLDGLASRVQDKPILCLPVGPVLDDLVNGVVLAKVLEVVLLAPAKPEAMDHLGGLRCQRPLKTEGI
jgi:hypothetical protein